MLRFERVEENDNDKGVIHVYYAETNTFLGFFKYKKSTYGVTQFAGDTKALQNTGKIKEITEEVVLYREKFINENILPKGFTFDKEMGLGVKIEYEVDYGDGRPPVKKVV